MILSIHALCASLLIFSGAVANSPFTSVTVPEAGAYKSDTALTDSTEPNVLPLVISVPGLGQFDEDDVAERFLRMVGDADGCVLAVGLNPLVFFRVFEIGWIGHELAFSS